jgi:hypothetical protein
MRRMVFTAAITLMLGTFSAGGSAHSQTSPQQPVASSPKLNLTLEQRHVIREIIKDMKPQSAAGEIKADVGDKIPADVTAQAMPTQIAQKVPQVKAHEFFVADGQIVIVDPKDKRIADIIKLTAD